MAKVMPLFHMTNERYLK